MSTKTQREGGRKPARPTARRAGAAQGSWSRRLHDHFKEVERPIGLRSKLRLVGSVGEGMSAHGFRSIGGAVPLSSAQWATILALPKDLAASWLLATGDGGRLTRPQAEQVKLVALVFLRAAEVIGGEDTAVEWLNTPLDVFDGKKPLQLLRTSTGTGLVLDQLGRMEHGVYS